MDSEEEVAEGIGVVTAGDKGKEDCKDVLSRFGNLVNCSLQIEGLISLCQQSVERAANYYRVFSLLMFMLLFFGKVCLQMQTKTAFDVQNPVIRAHLQGLDTDSFVVNKAQDILDWVDTTLVDAIFQDAKCGNGICESPSEYPGFGRFKCAADCGKYKVTSRIMLHHHRLPLWRPRRNCGTQCTCFTRLAQKDKYGHLRSCKPPLLC